MALICPAPTGGPDGGSVTTATTRRSSCTPPAVMDDALGAPAHLQRRPVAAADRPSGSTTAWRTSSRSPSRSSLGRGLLARPAAEHLQVAGLARRSATPPVRRRTTSRARTRPSGSRASRGRCPPWWAGHAIAADRNAVAVRQAERQSGRRTVDECLRRAVVGRPDLDASEQAPEHCGDQRLRRPAPEPPVGPALGHRRAGQHRTLLGREPLVVGRHLFGREPDATGRSRSAAPVRASSLSTPRPTASMM